MSKMFSPWHINKLIVPNRLVRSATWEGLAEEDGRASEQLHELYQTLAANKVGMIVTGLLAVSKRGKAAVRQMRIDDDRLLPYLARLVQEVHGKGAVIAAQLAHAGGQTMNKAIDGLAPLAPSAGVNLASKAQMEELSLAQIEEIIADFVSAALRAQKAGFDAVQLHMAHAYLISQFLSPFTNQRTDRYGGSAENRRRFALEVTAAVRRALGPDYPLLIKINALDEAVANGLNFEESLMAIKELVKLGVDAVEISGGIGGGDPEHSPSRKVKSAEDEGYFLQYALEVKKAVNVPVISVGGWRSLAEVEKALSQVDAVALSRALICQPNLPQLWYRGESLRAQCTSCNRCFILTPKNGLTCALTYKKEK